MISEISRVGLLSYSAFCQGFCRRRISLLMSCLWLLPAVLTVKAAAGGAVVEWGNNILGQVNVPAGLSGVTAIAGGSVHAVALKSDGTVVAWGENSQGQTTVPVGLDGVTAIAAGIFTPWP